MNKTIYLYPKCEDSDLCASMLYALSNRMNMDIEYIFVDDGISGSSLHELKDNIACLWIVHQDEKLREKLYENACKLLPLDMIFDGIKECEKILLPIVSVITAEHIDALSDDDCYILGMASLFVSTFIYHDWNSNNALQQKILKYAQEVSIYYESKYQLKKDSQVGIMISDFTDNKHLCRVIEKLQEQNIDIVFICFHEKFMRNDALSILLPPLAYFLLFLDIFAFYVVLSFPIKTPPQSSKKVYVPHAYIEPIASLVMRKRPFDNLWFRKKIGIGGYRVITSYSNYKIFKDKFEELGASHELLCAGYPSLDFNIDEYESFQKKLIQEKKHIEAKDILIAINNLENFDIIIEFLEYMLPKEQKIYLRPYPIFREHESFLALKKHFCHYPHFIYDTTEKLSVEIMASSLCLIGDFSSLVYTFPLTTLKPAILLFSDKSVLHHTYADVCFYNPLLHKAASNAQEVVSLIEEIKKDYKKKQNEIKNYRSKEVFNLGHSGEAIASFIAHALKK